MPMGAAEPSSTVAYSLLGAIKVVEIARQGCVSMRAGEDCGPFVEVLVVGDRKIRLSKQAGCEACAEDAVDAERWVSPEIVEDPLCCLRSDGSDLLVFDRRQQSGGTVPSSSVVEVVTPRHDDFASVGLRGEMMPGQHLVFEGGEERLRGGVVPRHQLHLIQ
jgi:hypothetical protein